MYKIIKNIRTVNNRGTMIQIDGSHGEGGGQILRTAVALSMVKGEKVRVNNIRANRPNPGLSHQHLMALKAAKDISDAEAEGLRKGSRKVTFEPDEIRRGLYKFDIGTAGSITLLLQTVLPPALLSGEPVEIEVRGGTDVKWSPPYDYFENVFLENLREMGAEIESELIKRGHYPKGGGKIKVSVEPSSLRDLEVSDKIEKIEGRAFVTNLPLHIARRMKKSALKELIEYDTSISVESYRSASAGTAITLWTRGGRIVGRGILGEKGVPAEKIGSDAAEGLMKDIRDSVDVDVWCADQLVPYLGLIDQNGVLNTEEKTGHLETNLWVVNQFMDDKMKLEEHEGYISIKY